MERFYCGAAALERVVDAALDSLGLEADYAAAIRRPPPAATFAEQQRRIDAGRTVLALVRRRCTVRPDDRLLIGRLVDGACARLEEAERDTAEPAIDPIEGRQDVPPMPATTNPRPRMTPPGTAAPAKTNPTRAIRSSRWFAPRKRGPSV
jgi:hypothetical protein